MHRTWQTNDAPMRRRPLPQMLPRPKLPIAISSSSPSGFFRGWRRESGDFQVDRAQVAPAGEKQSFPIVATEPDISRRRLAMDDATELLPLRIENIEPTGAAAIDIAGRVDLHAVGATGLRTAQAGAHAVGLLRQGAVGSKVEGPDMAAPEIVDIDHAFVGREGEPVREDHVIEQERRVAEIGREEQDAR